MGFEASDGAGVPANATQSASQSAFEDASNLIDIDLWNRGTAILAERSVPLTRRMLYWAVCTKQPSLGSNSNDRRNVWRANDRVSAGQETHLRKSNET
jgi:hypothetical protein